MYFFQSLFFLIIAGLSLSFMHAGLLLPTRNSFLIEEESELYIQGTSNVTDFTCHCLQEFDQQSFQTSLAEDGQTLFFSSTFLRIESQKLDCQNRRMNNDMHKTLLADSHPFIEVKLLKVQTNDGKKINEFEGWERLTAEALITIASVTKPVTLEVKGRQLGQGRFQLMSTRSLLMSDFNLTPPAPLMGLIKVSDQIDINFDLIVKIQDV